MDFRQSHSAVEVEAQKLSEHYVVFLRKERAHQLSAERARGAEILGAQVVLLFTGDLWLDLHHF